MKKTLSLYCFMAIIATILLSCNDDNNGTSVDALITAKLRPQLEGCWIEAYTDNGAPYVYQSHEDALQAVENVDIKHVNRSSVFIFTIYDNKLYLSNIPVRLNNPLLNVYENIDYYTISFYRNDEGITMYGELSYMTLFYKLIEVKDNYFIYYQSDGYHVCQRIEDVRDLSDYINSYVERNDKRNYWIVYKKQELSDGHVVKEETFTEGDLTAFKQDLRVQNYIHLGGDMEAKTPLLTYGIFHTESNTFEKKWDPIPVRMGLSSYEVGADIYFYFKLFIPLPAIQDVEQYELLEMTDTTCVVSCKNNIGEAVMIVYLRGIATQ